MQKYLLFITILFFISCKSQSPLDYPRISSKTAEYYTTTEKTFLFDSEEFKNIVSYTEPGQILHVCASGLKNYRTCTSGTVPPYFIKADSKLQKLTVGRMPVLTKIFAQEDYADFIFEQSGYFPAAIVNNSSANFEIVLSPVFNKIEYTRYEKTWRYGDIILSPEGKNAVRITFASIPACGVEILKFRTGILRIKYRDCRKNYLVALDPGHGGTEKGTCHKELCESDLALKLAQSVKVKLEKYKINSFLTRDSDKNMSLQERVSAAAERNSSLFVSLHFDQWSPANYLTTAPQGSACYYFHNFLSGPAKSICGDTSIKGLRVNNITQRSLYVLHSYNFPSVLFEAGNFAHESDAARMLEPGFMNDASEFLTNRILALSKLQ